MKDKIRILIADDHPVVRDGLTAMLGTQLDFDVVGEANTGLDVVRKAGTLHPDVVLLDLEMPEMDGVEALKQLRIVLPDVHAIVFTAFDTDERILSALKAGARGYLLKGAPRDDLFKAIRVASQGGSLLEPVVASRLLQHVSASSSLPEPLSAREMEVLGLIAEGHTNKDIADRLVISVRTVKFHVSAILRKLGADNRTEAVKTARQLKLISI